MLNLGHLLVMMATLAIVGASCPKAFRALEKKIAIMAVEAHKSGRMSVIEYHRKLTKKP
jgi:succinyl-CoA synthetase alpha subunit